MPSSVKSSCLYECRVMHHRFSPKEHRFDYRIFLFAIDLDELGSLDRTVGLFGVNRRALYSFREADYLPTGEALHNSVRRDAPKPGVPLKERVIAYLAGRGVELAGGKVVLVTLPRVAGYLFNPVSFYFCYDRDGAPRAAIAEVTNTFREMKAFFLGPQTLKDGAFRIQLPKNFYVSPFSDVDVSFDFTLREPSDSLAIRINDVDQGKLTLVSTLTGPRRVLTGTRLAFFTVKYPLITLRVITLIHLHALALWLKKVPWFAKSARPDDQTELYRPHASIARPTPS